MHKEPGIWEQKANFTESKKERKSERKTERKK